MTWRTTLPAVRSSTVVLCGAWFSAHPVPFRVSYRVPRVSPITRCVSSCMETPLDPPRGGAEGRLSLLGARGEPHHGELGVQQHGERLRGKSGHDGRGNTGHYPHRWGRHGVGPTMRSEHALSSDLDSCVSFSLYASLYLSICISPCVSLCITFFVLSSTFVLVY